MLISPLVWLCQTTLLRTPMTSNEQLIKLEEAEEEMLRNNLGKSEEILLEMLEEDDECIPVLNNLAHLYLSLIHI